MVMRAKHGMSLQPAGVVHVVVMAKPVIPGRVKTRLVGRLSPLQAAQVHAVMLGCVLERVPGLLSSELPVSFVLALDRSMVSSGEGQPEDGVKIPAVWRVVDQGPGNLGQRLARVWESLGGGSAVFLGADSPDLPREAMGSILPSLEHADAAVGPVGDGGYWTLAARYFQPQLVSGIDWGTDNVYDQTLAAARDTGLEMAILPLWHDVDWPEDLTALRERIKHSQEPALARLYSRLDRVLQDGS